MLHDRGKTAETDTTAEVKKEEDTKTTKENEIKKDQKTNV